MKVSGFWTSSKSLVLPSGVTPFTVAGLIHHVDSEESMLTSDLIFIQPDPEYWEADLTKDEDIFLTDAYHRIRSPFDRLTEGQIVDSSAYLFPGCQLQTERRNKACVLKEWLLHQVFGNLYSSILGGQILTFSYPGGRLTQKQTDNIQRFIWLLSENLTVHSSPPSHLVEEEAALEQIEKQVEHSGIQTEVIRTAAIIARFESCSGSRAFSLEPAKEYDTRYGSLEHGPLEVTQVILNRTQLGTPVSRGYFFQTYGGMLFLNALRLQDCLASLESHEAIAPTKTEACLNQDGVRKTVTTAAPPRQDARLDDFKPSHEARVQQAVATSTVIVNEIHLSAQAALNTSAPVSKDVSDDRSAGKADDSDKNSIPDEGADIESGRNLEASAGQQERILLKFLPNGGGQLQRNQDVLVEFYGHKIPLGKKTAFYLLCFCLTGKHDDGIILNSGRTTGGLDLTSELAGSRTKPEKFDGTRLKRVSSEIQGAFKKGLKEEGKKLHLKAFEFDGREYETHRLFPIEGEESSEARGRRFFLSGNVVEYAKVIGNPAVAEQVNALIEKFEIHYRDRK